MDILKTVELVFAILALIFFLLILRKAKRGRYSLNRDSTGFWRYHDETEFKRKISYSKKLEKNREKTAPDLTKKAIAVIEFNGDVRARSWKSFGELVDEITINREEISEAVVIVTSPGGVVTAYGNLYAQMERIRNSGLKLTVCIDTVAASGGYLMSLPADKILAAPYAIVGSVGVVAFVPNVRGLLKQLLIEPRTFTAGKWKRTISMTDDATPDEIARFQEQLQSIHQIFISSLKKYRPAVNLAEIETGDHWTAQESIEKNLGLVDELMTSHEYLLKLNETNDLLLLSQKKSRWDDRIPFLSSLKTRALEKLNAF
jgi:serine protease SohB